MKWKSEHPACSPVSRMGIFVVQTLEDKKARWESARIEEVFSDERTRETNNHN